MKIEISKIERKMLSGRSLAKSFIENYLEGKSYHEYELDFSGIEMVNQSFMNELVRSVFKTNPQAHIYVSNCESMTINDRFNKEIIMIKSIFEKLGHVGM